MSLCRSFALIILALCFSDLAIAAMSNEIKLVGKIVSFNQTTIDLKSGNRVFTLNKSDLKYPSYKIGDQLEIELSQENLSKLKSRAAQ